MRKTITVCISIVLILTFTIPVYAELKKGSKGNDVIALQERLIELGYLDGAADGIFGKMTEAAVESFQKANGLDITGVATIKDINILFSDDTIAIRSVNSDKVPESVFHEANYESYNSPASENGLKDDRLHLRGVILSYNQNNDITSFILQQNDEKKWWIVTGQEGKIDV